MQVRRDELLDMVLRHEGTPEVKVLVGVRRCGKSTLLQMFADALAERGISQENMFFKALRRLRHPYRLWRQRLV
jgi:predicted AAA+ superfamily ATPase